jgi:hypothetical protein
MDAVANVARRVVPEMQTARLTNFYPTYDGANDQVDRIVPVRRAFFQRVVPRYRLSMSETRDQGLGPRFLDTHVSAPRKAERLEPHQAGSAAHDRPSEPPRTTVFREDYRGRYVDVYA